jgi:hypothetical protein
MLMHARPADPSLRAASLDQSINKLTAITTGIDRIPNRIRWSRLIRAISLPFLTMTTVFGLQRQHHCWAWCTCRGVKWIAHERFVIWVGKSSYFAIKYACLAHIHITSNHLPSSSSSSDLRLTFSINPFYQLLFSIKLFHPISSSTSHQLSSFILFMKLCRQNFSFNSMNLFTSVLRLTLSTLKLSYAY